MPMWKVTGDVALFFLHYFYTEEVSPMTQSTIHDDFTGYIHNVKENDRIIRERVLQCIRNLHEKNLHCLNEAKIHGKEKLFSEIETIHKRLEKFEQEISKTPVADFKIEGLDRSDEDKLKMIEEKIERLANECGEIIDSLSCLQLDTNIIDQYTRIASHLRLAERLYHERMMILKKAMVFG